MHFGKAATKLRVQHKGHGAQKHGAMPKNTYDQKSDDNQRAGHIRTDIYTMQLEAIKCRSSTPAAV